MQGQSNVVEVDFGQTLDLDEEVRICQEQLADFKLRCQQVLDKTDQFLRKAKRMMAQG